LLSVIPVGEWLPDLPENQNPGALMAKNVLPGKVGYLPMQEPSESYNALTNRAQGHFSCKDAAGNARNYAGDVGNLYHLSGATWSDISKAATTYTTPPTGFWEFTQWNDTVIAVNGSEVPQRASLGATAFVDLGGAPPVSKHIAVVKDFVVLGNTASGPNHLRWSAFQNSESYTITTATQADEQFLYGDGGGIQRIVGGEFGTIFQDRQLVRMQYVGPPVIFQFEVVDRNRGSLNAAGVIPVGDITFYMSDSGFFVWDGSRSHPIGDQKIDRYFFNDVDFSYIERVYGGADVERKIAMWIYPGEGSVSGACNKYLAYNWGVTRWSTGEINAEILCQFLSPGFTMDDIDGFGTVDTIGISFDSRQWQGGQFSFGSFSTNHKLATFSGDVLAATVDTGEATLKGGVRAFIRGTRPIVEGGAATVAVGSRNLLSSASSFMTAVSQRDSGYCPQRVDARYNRFRIQSSAFTSIIGVEVDWDESGAR